MVIGRCHGDDHITRMHGQTIPVVIMIHCVIIKMIKSIKMIKIIKMIIMFIKMIIIFIKMMAIIIIFHLQGDGARNKGGRHGHLENYFHFHLSAKREENILWHWEPSLMKTKCENSSGSDNDYLPRFKFSIPRSENLSATWGLEYSQLMRLTIQSSIRIYIKAHPIKEIQRVSC